MPIDNEESARRAAERLLGSPAGRRALLALEKTFEVVERERGINDDESEALPGAQQAIIDALHEVYVASGADKSLLRRSVGFVLNKPRASDAEVERILCGIEADPDARSEPQRRVVRKIVTRVVADLGLPQRITSFAAWMLFLGVNGRKATPNTPKGKNALASDEGEVWDYVPQAGIDPDGGPAEVFRVKLVRMIGYTAGHEELPRTHCLTASILDRALKAWNAMKARAHCSLPAIRPRTIRQWCGSAGGPFKYGEQFDIAYRRGIADQAGGKTDMQDFLPWV